MTKLTFDVDFNKDPEEILREIQERAKAEVAKRESKIKSAAFLSKLHEKVNQEIGTDYKTVNDLIRALTPYANPKLRDKISSTSPTGRRVTVSMSRELYEEIKSKLAQPNSNKAAIARETGASVVQVRKVANGGFDEKFSASKKIDPKNMKQGKSAERTQPEIAAPEAPSPTPLPTESENPPPAPSLDLPPTPPLPEPPALTEAADEVEQEDATPALPPIGGEISDDPVPLVPPPAPSLDLPPTPSLPEPPALTEPADEIEQEDALPDLPPIAPPSMGAEVSDEPTPLAPPPAPSLDLPPTPSLPEPPALTEPADEIEQEDAVPDLPPIAPPSMGTEISDEPTPLAPPPAPSLELPPSPMPSEPSLGGGDTSTEPSPTSNLAPKKPSLSLKPKGGKLGIGAKKGKPTLSLKSGKKKSGGLKITRPPMKPPTP